MRLRRSDLEQFRHLGNIFSRVSSNFVTFRFYRRGAICGVRRAAWRFCPAGKRLSGDAKTGRFLTRAGCEFIPARAKRTSPASRKTRSGTRKTLQDVVLHDKIEGCSLTVYHYANFE
jgi:hypothetical protein